MRQKTETASLADRLNNALAQLHAQKIAFDQQRTDLLGQLDKAKEESERLRARNRELRRGREQQGHSDGQGEQIVLKIQHYLARVQESCKQMAQVASECRVFDAEIQRAAALIQRNILKTVSGLQKYSQELVRQWCQRETLRLENCRLEAENKQLFELTTKLQQNFKETDRCIKQLSRGTGQDKYTNELRGRIHKLEEERENHGSAELEEKIVRLGEKVRLLEQENTTIKNIHQRTMKKLQKLQQRNRQQEEQGPNGAGGQGLQEQRRRWLQKHEELHEEVRRLTKQLLLAEQSQSKAKEELDGCVEIYAQWEVQREERKAQIDKLRVAIETYLQKIEELERALGAARGETEAMIQRLQVSEAEKEKIVSVYQLQVQELNDLLFKKQDALSEMDAVISREHIRLEQLKKQHAELTKFTQNLQDNHKKAVAEAADVRQLLIDQQQIEQGLKEQIAQRQQAMRQIKLTSGKEKEQLLGMVEREQRQKEEMAEIMSQYKEQYYAVKKETSALQEDIQALRDQQFSVKQELRSMLGNNDDSLDVWTLLAKIRDQLTAFLTQNKNLKEAQRQLLVQSQRKQQESSAQLEELEQKYEALRESREDQKRNEEFSLRMCKMKAVERQICSENALFRVDSFKDLAQMIIGVVKKDNCLQETMYDNGQIEELRKQLLTLQQQRERLVDGHQKTKAKLSKTEQEITILRQMTKDNQSLRKQLQYELNASVRDLTVQRQLSQRLIEQCECLKLEREATNGEMAALAGQLSKIQNEMEDYQDEKTSIQSKLQNARRIHTRNQQLEERVRELEVEVAALNSKIEQLQGRLQEKKQAIDNDSSSNLLDFQEGPARQGNKHINQQDYLSQINVLLQETTQLQNELQVKLTRIDQLEHSIVLMDQNHQLQAIKISHLQQQLEEYRKELDQYKLMCQRWEQQGAVLSAVREELQRKEQESKQQLMQNASEYIDLTLENQASKHEIQELEERLEMLQDELQIKNAKISSLSADLQRVAQQKEHFDKQNAKNAQLHNQLIAKQEQLKISLAYIHQKEAQLLKREQQIKEKQQFPLESSLLGMQSLRQSQAHRSQDEAIKQQLREQVYILKQAVLARDVSLMAKQAAINNYMQVQSENQAKIQQHQKEITQLQEQLGEYREHSDHLKESLIEMKQQSHGQYEELRRQKQSLQLKFLQSKQLLSESLLKSQELAQRLERITLEHNDQIQQLQHQLQHKQMRIRQYQSTIQEHEATIKHFTSLLAQKQDLLHQKAQQLQEKSKAYQQLITQSNNIKVQNEALHIQLALKEGKCAQVQAQISVSRQQNLQYAQRLSEIEEIMDAVRREQNESQILRERLEDALQEKRRLEQAMTGMQSSFAFSSNNIAIFEKRNQELSQELSSSRQHIEALRLNCEKISKQLQKSKESAVLAKEALSRYEKIGSITEIGLKIEDYPNVLREFEANQQQSLQLKKTITQLKAKLQQVQRQLMRKDQQLSSKEAARLKLQAQCQQLKEVSRKNGTLDEQNERLSNKTILLKQDLEQLREELLEKQAKLSELKESHAKELAQRQLLQSQLKDREAECHALQQQAEHYKQQVKRLGKEKAQAKSEAIKSKLSLQEQQSVLKVKEGTLMRESSERDEMIRQLKQEVDSLREQNSVLLEQGQIQSINRTSRRSSIMGNVGYEIDIPLQMPPRGKQKSAYIQQKQQQNQQYRFPKGEEKLGSRLYENEKSNASLSSEIQALRGELRGKQANMDSLQRQFKSKAEDYSKLQRIVESLRDELNLQRKRVRNFEDLYQSIQEKRIKMAVPKQQ